MAENPENVAAKIPGVRFELEALLTFVAMVEGALPEGEDNPEGVHSVTLSKTLVTQHCGSIKHLARILGFGELVG